MIHKLLEQVHQDFQGLIWLTSSPLSLYTPIGQALNYLSNGIMGKSFTHHQGKNQQEFLCLTQNFAHPFFIFHKEINKPLDCLLKNPQIIQNLLGRLQTQKITIGVLKEDPQIDIKLLVNQWRELHPTVTLQKISF